MKHTKIVEVPATTKEIVYKTTCDFCGGTLPCIDFEFSVVTIEHNEGSSYPECGSGEKTTFDCCPDCWSNKVMPALRAMGAEPSTEEWEI